MKLWYTGEETNIKNNSNMDEDIFKHKMNYKVKMEGKKADTTEFMFI